jgi:hypothetical protein
MIKKTPRLWIFAGLLSLTACSGQADSGGVTGPDKPLEPGTKQTLTPSPEQQAEQKALEAALAAAKNLDAAGFAKKYSVPFSNASLGYDPLTAKNMTLVQSSNLALDSQEQAMLSKHGFVISDRKTFPSFVYGYESIYLMDLPVYVSADSILYAVHESYDSILMQLEMGHLIPALADMLKSMRGKLAGGVGADINAAAVKDTDFYLSVALSLLSGSFEAPVAGGDSKTAEAFYQAANQASGAKKVTIFDVARLVDFSQFKPRGHYANEILLSRYFRAMMWLGRIDFRILETQEDGSQVFRRRQLEAAYVIRALLDETALGNWTKIDNAVGAFVGEADNMTLPDLDALLGDVGAADATQLAKISDATLSQAVVDGGYGTQRISSHIMINGLNDGTLPLSSTFLLLGQRYVIDSHVFSNVVYDRVAGGSVKRMMPNPLDVGFAALGNDQAGLLLAPELSQYAYAPDLASMRVLVDAHPQQMWRDNLYTGWLSALRTLSPSAEVASPATAGLPTVASTEAWGRRLLNTQLASWSELRHDTILYAKQSYTGGASCEYPSAYVDPYPKFFQELRHFSERGEQVMNQFSPNNAAYFKRLAEVLTILEEMATNQRTGAPHSAAHLAFINQAVKIEPGCGEPSMGSGWYRDLFFDPSNAIEFDPVIADVHTQPTDESGNPVGRVLHVGTGMPRVMVVTTNDCTGSGAYVGLVSSYFEKITENFQRMDDKEWASGIQNANPADVPWLQDLVVR